MFPLNTTDSIASMQFQTDVTSSFVYSSTMHFSDSEFGKQFFHNDFDKEYRFRLDKKYSELKNNIGVDLFNKLSDQQKKFIINVSGAIQLGKNIDTADLIPTESEYE